jgi:aspartyl-tRNA(Asn)/glutamyl-tRNA(Gln) amidotransferase subunit A
MTRDDIAYLPATVALARFRTGALSPVDLMTAVIDRAERVEPTVNALCLTYFDEALVTAKEAERRYAGHGPAPRALEGLPVAIKDEVPVMGQPCSEGSLLLKDDIADHHAPIAERILEAGGIIHARTTTPEFCCAGFTHSKLWGVTRNPWNAEFAVGGSSGGSGAALASGTATLASGSDIGGSIRIPASFNGVVGFKPPFGRVPVDPPFNLDQYCHDGPMARTVADCALFENVIAGPHPADIVSLRPKLQIPESLDGIEGMRVGLSVTMGDWPVDEDVAANTEAAAGVFREAGAVVVEVDPGLRREDVLLATRLHWSGMFGAAILAAAEEYGELMTPYALEMARQCQEALTQATYADGLEIEAAIWRRLSAVFDHVDVLVSSAALTRGLVAGDDYVSHGLRIGGVQVEDYFEGFTTAVFNIASRCPVLNVPSGFARNGVPTGLQIAGRTYDDVTVFRAGAAYERLRPWLDEPAHRPLRSA